MSGRVDIGRIPAGVEVGHGFNLGDSPVNDPGPPVVWITVTFDDGTAETIVLSGEEAVGVAAEMTWHAHKGLDEWEPEE